MPIASGVRRRVTAATFVAGLMVLSACSDSRKPGGGAAPKAPDKSATHVETIQLDAADYGTISAKISDTPLASAPSTVTGIQIDVFSLTRTGDNSVTLILALNNTNATKAGLETTDYYSEDPGGSSVSAISLFDPNGLKQYLTFRQPGNDPSNAKKLGPCLCSSAFGLLGSPPKSSSSLSGMEPGERVYLAAIFPAPPPEVTKMTVQAGFGAVPDVPLARG